MLAPVLDTIASAQAPDQVDGLVEHLATLGDAGPALGEGLLVEPLAGADAEEESFVEHDSRRGCGVGDIDRGVAVDDRRDPGSDLELLGRVGERPEHGPGVG